MHLVMLVLRVGVLMHWDIVVTKLQRLDLLKYVKQPATLQLCWIRTPLRRNVRVHARDYLQYSRTWLCAELLFVHIIMKLVVDTGQCVPYKFALGNADSNTNNLQCTVVPLYGGVACSGGFVQHD